MKREIKTKKQPVNQLVQIRHSNTEVETLASKRKRAEEETGKSEERYRMLFNDSKDAVYVSTREGKFASVNQSLLELLGYTRGRDTQYGRPSDICAS